MRKLFLGLLFVAAGLLVLQPVEAQTALKDPRPGYLVFRILLDDGKVAVADPNNPNAPPAAAAADPTHTVAAVVPYKFTEKRLVSLDNPNKRPDTNPYMWGAKHKYGWVFPAEDKTQIQLFLVPNTSAEREVNLAYENWAKKRSYDGIHDIVERALAYGMVDEAWKHCEEYLRMPKLMENLPKTQRFEAFAKAFEKLPDALLMTEAKKDAKWAPNPLVASMKGDVRAAGSEESKYYSVVYFDTNQAGEAKQKAAMLDRNVRAFYLWHALNGIQLQVPKTRLIALLSDSTTRIAEYRAALDGRPVLSDAFYSPVHNVLMIAPERMDPYGNAFMNLVRAKYSSGWSREDLLANRMALSPGKAADALRMQMLAVSDKFITEEGENAAISREGCRQLMAASGMVPQHVQLPLWLENGVGHFFERSKSGQVYLRENDGIKMSVALATGYGAPNIVKHRHFDKHRPIMSRRPELALINVITNAYYHAMVSGRDADPILVASEQPNQPPREEHRFVDPEDQGPRARAFRAMLKEKAEAASWGLVFYLEKASIFGLQKFYAELSRLPRDMKLEEDEILRIFCKSFGLLKTDLSIDYLAVRTFATNWLQFMGNLKHADYLIRLDAANLDPFPAAAAAAGVGPGGGGPGGGGPGPGGAGGGPPPAPPPGGGGGPPPGRPGG